MYSLFKQIATASVFLSLVVLPLATQAQRLSPGSSCPVITGEPYRSPFLTTVFVITPDCKKRPIFNPDVYFSHFENWNKVIFLEQYEVDAIPDHPLRFMPWGARRTFVNGSLVKTTDDPRVYLVQDGKAHPIESEAAFSELGYAFNQVEDVDPAVLAKFIKQSETIKGSQNIPTSIVFKYAGDPKVYVIKLEDGEMVKEHLTSMEAVRQIYRADRIIILPPIRTFPDIKRPVTTLPPPQQPITPTTTTTPQTPPVTTPTTTSTPQTPPVTTPTTPTSTPSTPPVTTPTSTQPTPDTTIPTVSFTLPSSGASVSGSISIQATAGDNIGVSSVQFKIGSNTITTDASSPYSITLDTTPYSNGSYILTATAVDAAGNQAVATRSVTISNTDPVPGSEQCNDGVDNDGDGLTDWQYDLGCYGAVDNSEGGIASGSLDNGWTVFEPSADSRIVYVSFSTGNDSNSGLSAAAPKKTIASAKSLLRNGYPDWMLLKRGDVWQEGVGDFALSGRSPQEPIVFAAYGSGARPKLEFAGTGIRVIGNTGVQYVSNLAITGLHLQGQNRDPELGVPGTTNSTCVNWMRGANDVLFEDTQFRFCQVIFQIVDGYPAQRITLRRNLFLDSYSNTESHAQCIFLSGDLSLMRVEENVLDRCGWHPLIAEADPTKFNHGIYWQNGTHANGVVRNNLIMRTASHGIQMRSSGWVEGNVFAHNAINGFLGNGWRTGGALTGIQGALIGNVIVEGEDITPREGHPTPADGSAPEYRGWGWELNALVTDVVLRDNILANNASYSGKSSTTLPAASVFSGTLTDVRNNIVWNWGTAGSNYQPENSGPFPDPGRSLASYHATVGGTATFDAFATELRKQSKTNWRTEYTSGPVISYFRQGFGLSP